MNGLPSERRRLVIGAAAIVIVAGLLYGGWVWWQSRSQVTTDDAYVEGSVAVVSSKVSGNVVELLVRDNQPVKAGDVLLRLDPRDLKAKRDQARAAVAVAQSAVQEGEAILEAKRAAAAAAAADAAGAKANATQATRETERQRKLV